MNDVAALGGFDLALRREKREPQPERLPTLGVSQRSAPICGWQLAQGTDETRDCPGTAADFR